MTEKAEPREEKLLKFLKAKFSPSLNNFEPGPWRAALKEFEEAEKKAKKDTKAAK